MLSSSVDRLRCPACRGALSLAAGRSAKLGEQIEVSNGVLTCKSCQQHYPILAGVAVLVTDPSAYVVEHVKGISALVDDDEIPKPVRDEYLEAKAELEPEHGVEHIEEDLESERVIALYFMNHYLAASGDAWWKPAAGTMSPLIDRLIREHWDHGPLARITQWLNALPAPKGGSEVIELGCGVGGLSRAVLGRYLGVDSSFASIALGRRLALGAPYARPIRIPNDLFTGALAREIQLPPAPAPDGRIELVVGDLGAPPAERGAFDAAVALNAIDMLPEPADLPRAQAELLRKGGVAIQSCPYIWHAEVARELRERVPAGVADSASAVEWLYAQAGLQIGERVEHLPWLFLKHSRQLEIYSVHLFQARKSSTT